MIARHPCGTRMALLPLLPSGPGGVRRVSLRRTRLSIFLSCRWRRGWDSNPRYTFWAYTRFPVVPLQPLGHLSFAFQQIKLSLVLSQQVILFFVYFNINGGEGGIRTHGAPFKHTSDFESPPL